MATEQEKLAAIQKHFAPVIGKQIVRYATAEILYEDGTWDSWTDLPVRIYTTSAGMVAVSWSKFDDLWLANDDSLPFSIEGSTTRWVANGLPEWNACLGATISAVLLGRGAMSIEGRDIEIWTRLVLTLSRGWLEIFNALDENAYAFHEVMPDGEFVDVV